MTMDFDGVVAWLRDHLGQRVVAAAQGDGNTGLSVVGPLLKVDDREINLVDARPGRVEVFAVGGATLVLLEGDFLAAGTTDFGTGRPALVQATFRELVVTVAETPA
ncbi:MAG: hypothetical protein JWR63_2379 [Conexibacter sp.]|nr:hypothetical protein [Conexibacter sp.]